MAREIVIKRWEARAAAWVLAGTLALLGLGLSGQSLQAAPSIPERQTVDLSIEPARPLPAFKS